MSFVLTLYRNQFKGLSCASRFAHGRRFRSHLIELDSDQNVGATGFDVVMQRAANILICNADQQFFTKILHVYPESTLTTHLSKVMYEGIVISCNLFSGVSWFLCIYCRLRTWK